MQKADRASDKGLHLAIIPDGNRRWAKSKGLLAWNGHEKAMDIFRDIVEFCRADERIDCLTLWCFSTENWKRDPEEITKLMNLLSDFLRKERVSLQEKSIRLVHSGRKDRIPAALAALINDIEAEGKALASPTLTLHMALDYGGKDEVTRAVRLLPPGSDITEQAIREHLDHPELPDIDLIIRTSGEQRTSNFFLWQSAYAEWVFTEKFFPEFTSQDISLALDNYLSRSRRFGS